MPEHLLPQCPHCHKRIDLILSSKHGCIKEDKTLLRQIKEAVINHNSHLKEGAKREIYEEDKRSVKLS